MAELGKVTLGLLAAASLPTIQVLADELCRLSAEALDIGGASLSVHPSAGPGYVLCAGNERARQLEELQLTLGEGPTPEAARTGRPVLAPDLSDPATTVDWPTYAAAAVGQIGVCALFAFPLQWGSVNLGVLSLHRQTPGSLARDDLRDAVAAADLAALIILGLRTAPEGDGSPWDDSWSHQAELHQATGMVVAQLDVSASDAFARLRAYAFAEQRSLSEVSGDVVARRVWFDIDTDTGR